MSDRRVVCVDGVPTGSMFDCSVCGKVGMITCSGCGSIRYCSKPCQQTQWSQHKDICDGISNIKNEIRELSRKLEKRFGSLVNFTSGSYGSPDLFLDTTNYIELSSYIFKRSDLILVLAVCGLENNSNLAKDLAVEHILDLIQLNSSIGELYCELGILLMMDLNKNKLDLLVFAGNKSVDSEVYSTLHSYILNTKVLAHLR